MTAPAIEPARPIDSVSQTGIGSGPGIASRASAPVTKPEKRIARTKPRFTASDARRRRALRRQVAAQLLDLVPELRRVLEPQLLGRLEHLLLERDHQLLEIVPRHP